MLPDTNDAHPLKSEICIDRGVTFNVLSQLACPECKSRPRCDVVLWAPMPEAAVKKNRNPAADEPEVR